MKLYEQLGITKGITSVIGSGGKTTLIRQLAEELKEQGTVIVATSTKTFVPDWCVNVIESDEDDARADDTARRIRREFDLQPAGQHIVSVGTQMLTETGRVKMCPPRISFAELAMLADYVLVEADGSKMLPLKAHAEHEPVIPKGTVQTIQVVGMRGLGHPISDVAHRSEIYARLAGAGVSDIVTPQIMADVINSENLADLICITQLENELCIKGAGELLELLDKRAIYKRE